LSQQWQRRLSERAQLVNRTRLMGASPYERVITGNEGMRVTVDGMPLLNLCSYSYQSLCCDITLYDEACQLARPYALGNGGTRVVCGTTQLHVELEQALAEWLGTETALLLPSGFSANSTLLPALVEPADWIYADEYVHASLKDGIGLCRGQAEYWKHNDLEHLERLLRKPCAGIRWVVVDGVYSMDGDLAPLPELRRLCDEHGACLYVDDAHGMGVLGSDGAGTFQHFDLVPGVNDLLMGTVSKAIPGIGGFVAGSRALRDALLGSCRAFVFSSATPPFDVAVALLAIRRLRDNPGLVRELRSKVVLYCEELARAGVNVPLSETAIVPIHCGESRMAIEIARRCQADGLYVLPAMYPVVPLSSARIRTTVCNGIPAEELRAAVPVLARHVLEVCRS